MLEKTPFEKDCEEISEKLDQLSDWEVKFYVYCLIPRFVDLLKADMHPAENSCEYMANAKLIEIINALMVAHEALVYDIF